MSGHIRYCCAWTCGKPAALLDGPDAYCVWHYRALKTTPLRAPWTMS